MNSVRRLMMVMIRGLGVQSFVNTYTSLPVKQQKRLEEKAQAYVQALDQAIAQVLSPTIGRSEGQFLVTDDVIPLYGMGPSPEEAMADYRSVVVEYYESLEEDAEELGHALRKQLELLRQISSLLEKVP
jgi:hypothetical protein